MKRNVYLNTIDIEEAKALFFKEFKALYEDQFETVEVINSLNRITAAPVMALISNPNYNAAAMDGIALDASVTFGAHERNPITLTENVDFKYVDTGDCLADEYNAVVMIEDVYVKDDGRVDILKSSHPWEHVRVVGEDIAVGDMILPSQHRVSPVDIGAILSAGVTEIKVVKKLRVGILPTGTEIINPGETMNVGNIIDSNSRVFENMVLEAGGIPNRYNPIKDDQILLRAGILKAVEENDIVVINAGSSAGTEDYTAGLIAELGEVFVHGIAIKPGKPTILGKVKNKAIVGIPGYPVSAFISFRAFVIPFISGHMTEIKGVEEQVILSRRIVSALKHKEFVRMKLGKVGNKLIGTPLSRGAGVTMSLVKADGILAIPKHVEGYEAGAVVTVELLRPLTSILESVVSIGSHDIIMDQINDLMKKEGLGFSMSSVHVGSLGGIMAIRNQETHIAPVHLLDETTGEYNLSYIKKYLKNEPVVLLKGIKRWQGFYVEKGNPIDIKSIEDIKEKGYLFANRQKGSGTRTLLDYYLKRAEIDSDLIKGYENELTTHTAVALSVQSGNSQVGLGIQSVALQMGLDFIPMGLEDYDFIIPIAYLEEAPVKAFIKILESAEFKACLNQLGGYELENQFTMERIMNKE